TLFPMLWDYSRSKTGLEYLETLLYYLFKASPNLEKDAFIEEFHKLPNPELLEEVVMPTMAQQWIDEGFEKGIEKGIEKGLRRTVEKQLLIKFREIPAIYLSQLSTLSFAQLETLAERILTAQSLEELFRF
ncbi:MAG: DUF4351 domain-containing protein, partial [SAR324 cluster bacterium]|nr:DUF4351 domain-containing protein [SAR324 cluster bacterium]